MSPMGLALIHKVFCMTLIKGLWVSTSQTGAAKKVGCFSFFYSSTRRREWLPRLTQDTILPVGGAVRTKIQQCGISRHRLTLEKL